MGSIISWYTLRTEKGLVEQRRECERSSFFFMLRAAVKHRVCLCMSVYEQVSKVT